MLLEEKHSLRKLLRETRRDHVAAINPATSALLFLRPPAPLLQMVKEDATVGLYHSTAHEAPAGAYARFFFERGHRIALPRFATRGSPMEFAAWTDPFEESDCEVGPFGLMQPLAGAESLVPGVVIVPLVGFTERGERLGQGGGHYDCWLEDHPDTTAIGLAWDCQLVDELPLEKHDRRLTAVITPSRFYGPF